MVGDESLYVSEEAEGTTEVPLIIQELALRLTQGISEALESFTREIVLPPAEEAPKPKYLSEAQWKALYKNHLITERKLSDAIQRFYVEPTQASAIIEDIIIDTWGWVTDKLLAEVLEKAIKGVLPVEDLVDIVKDMGMPDSYRAKLVKYVLLAQYNPQKFSKSELFQLWGSGRISEEELRVRLQNMGWAVDDINLLIAHAQGKGK